MTQLAGIDPVLVRVLLSALTICGRLQSQKQPCVQSFIGTFKVTLRLIVLQKYTHHSNKYTLPPSSSQKQFIAI